MNIARDKRVLFVIVAISSLFLQACSNGFHLRKNVDLPSQYRAVQLLNISTENDFNQIFENALEDAGGQVATTSSTQIIFSNFQEGRRVIAYTSERKAREYLLFLKFDYAIKYDKNNTAINLAKRQINIDRSYLYDPDFALGKAEEEKQVRKNLYEEAARLILFRLQYSK